MNPAVNRLRVRAHRPLDAWYDQPPNRAVVMLLAGFVIAWTAFHVIANASIDLHGDMVELYAWSRHPSAGYYKHPPLGALIVGAWFAVFPVADWSFHLLAMVNAAVGLFAVDLIAGRYLTGDKRLVVLLLLLLTPFYQFFGQRFATNQMLLSTWPVATYCFLRAFETRKASWAVAAGGAAAVAMLAKYYSVFLIGSFAVAALSHPQRWQYLKSPAPWISIAASFAVLAPHLHWLVTTGYQPIRYAADVHASSPLPLVVWRTLTYLAGGAAYVAVLVLAYVLAVRPSRQTLANALWPSDPDRRMLALLLAGQVLLPALAAPFIGARLTSLWTMSAWFLLPILLLAPPTVQVPRQAARHLALAVLAMTVGSLLVAPWLAWTYHVKGTRHGSGHSRLASEELVRQWRQITGRPLSIVMGPWELAPAATFYTPDRPDALPILWLWAYPWITGERLQREGYAALCPVDDRSCSEEAERLAAAEPGAARREVEIAPHFLGIAGNTERFLIVMVPPK